VAAGGLIDAAALPYLYTAITHIPGAGAGDSVPAVAIHTDTAAGIRSHCNIRTDAVIRVSWNQITGCIILWNRTRCWLQQCGRQSCHQARRD
jgi:hypothetical protein